MVDVSVCWGIAKRVEYVVRRGGEGGLGVVV